MFVSWFILLRIYFIFCIKFSFQVPLYRLSIAWTRIYPNGTGTVPNAEGVDFYNRFIDALLEIGVEPLVTLYHWDLPSGLEGGWLNESTTDAYANYADTCFRLFGDRVWFSVWINNMYIALNMNRKHIILRNSKYFISDLCTFSLSFWVFCCCFS